MICPKCGAKLVSGTAVCPICGSRQKTGPAQNGQDNKRTAAQKREAEPRKHTQYQDEYDEYDDGYQDDYDRDGDYEDDYGDPYEEKDYGDRYDRDYDSLEDEYQGRKTKKVRGILIGIIISVVIIIGILVALIVMLIQNQGGQPHIPETIGQNDSQAVGGSEAEKTTAGQEESSETEEPSIEIQGQQIKVDGNIYRKNDDGKTVTLVEYNGNLNIVMLPAEVGGYTVTIIGSHAFENSKNVQYLKLPDELERLDTFSLYDLSELKEVVIPSSVTEIRTYAFSRVETCITPEGSFAASHMIRIADKVVYGDSLSIESGTRVPVTNPGNQSIPAYTTSAPTNPPATNPPVTNPPATEAPATNPPATEAPATNPPATEAPATNPPATDAPATDAPATDAPATDAPATDAPATDAPATDAPATDAPATDAPATEPTETEAPEPPETEAPQPPETEPPETERNEDSVRAMIEAASQGTVLDLRYQSFGGDGTEVGFAIVQEADGSRSCWFNSPAAGSVRVKEAIGDASGSVVDFGLGPQYVLTGGGTTSIYQSDGSGCSGYAVDLPGNFDVNAMTLNTGSQIAYLTVEDGTLYEYAAEPVSREQVEGLTGGTEILELINMTIGDTSGAAFWNRANGMIQVAMPDGRYINLWKVGSGVSLTAGTLITSGQPEIYDGTVSSQYTVLPAKTPSPLPAPLKEILTISENSPAAYDINGDGTDETVSWTREANADGMWNLVLSVNGAECYRTSATADNYTVELCDIDSSSPGYNLVIYGTGGVTGNFLEIGEGIFSQTLSLTAGSGVLQGMGSFQGIGLSAGHILSDVNGDGTFKIALANPVPGLSSGTYYVSVPFTAGGELSGQTEYDIVDLTGAGSAALAREVNACSSPSLSTQGTVLGAGETVVPRKLVYSEGTFFVYTEVPQPLYLPVDGNPLY